MQVYPREREERVLRKLLKLGDGGDAPAYRTVDPPHFDPGISTRTGDFTTKSSGVSLDQTRTG